MVRQSGCGVMDEEDAKSAAALSGAHWAAYRARASLPQTNLLLEVDLNFLQ